MVSSVLSEMLFAGCEVREVKNCDLGLENAALGLRPQVAFSRPRSQFFTIQTDPKPVNNLFIFCYFKVFWFNKTLKFVCIIRIGVRAIFLPGGW